jgi:hypothetical protein
MATTKAGAPGSKVRYVEMNYAASGSAARLGIGPLAEADNTLVGVLAGYIDGGAVYQRRCRVLDQRRLVPSLVRTVGVRIVEV